MRKRLLSLAAVFCMAMASMAQVTFTSTAGQNFGTNEGSDKVLDGNVNTKWCTNTGADDGSYLLFTASEAIRVWGYKLTTANDNEQYGRELKAWELYGTNDESVASDKNSSAWVSLSKYTNSGVIARKNYYEQLFYTNAGASKTAYKYFKFVIRDSGFFQFSELSLCYSDKPALEYNWVEGSNGDTKKMVDMSVQSKMEGNNLASNWVIIETEDQKAHTIKSYAISTNDDGEWPNRAPRKWTVEGSNDKTEWTVIDKVTEGDPIQNVDGTTFEFPVKDLDAAYRYVKFTLDEMKSTGWNQVGEFHVFGSCEAHNWVMTAGKEATCVEDGGAEYTCSECGTKKLTGVIPATGIHTYADNHCTGCHRPDPSAVTKVDGFYEPTTVADFNLLAEMIQYGEDVNIRLTQDVDLSGFAGFGNGTDVVPFKGEFDGQGHWLKNFVTNVSKKNTGLFGMIEDANIHDLGLDNAYVKTAWGNANAGGIAGNAKNATINRVAVVRGSYVEGYDHVGAIVGNTEGSTIISNCLSDITVLSGAYQAGGLVGTSNGLTLENCLFTGEVRNNNFNSSGLVAMIDSENAPTTLLNNISAAYNIWVGQGEGLYSLINTDSRSATYENNRVAYETQFTKGDDSEIVIKTLTNPDDANGLQTRTAEMQGITFLSTEMGWDMTNDWKMIAAGQWPVLAWMEGETPTQTVSVSDAGYATFVADSDLAPEEDVYYAKFNDETKKVDLYPTRNVYTGQAFIVKGKGDHTMSYALDPVDLELENELIPVKAEEGERADGTQYILAEKDGKVGFYQATPGTTIAKGKAYLVFDFAGAKSFYSFLEEDGETAISGINAEENENAAIYNLAGQRISKAQKGINIIGGKKVLR